MKRHRIGRIAAWSISTLLVVYVAGFWGVVLLLRSEVEGLRIAGLAINYRAYDALIQASPRDSVLRRMAVDRIRWLCRGYEARCSVSE